MCVADPLEQAWLAAARQHAEQAWLANADLEVLDLGEARFATRLKSCKASDSYVLSPRSAWIRYPLAEAGRHLAPRYVPAARVAGHALDGLFQLTRLEQAASLGNFLVSTNLYPDDADLEHSLSAALCASPAAPVIVRSVCPALHPQFAARLDALGFAQVVARKILTCDPREPALWKHNHVRKDQKLLDDGAVEVVPHAQIDPADLPALHQRFRQLFIDKHSPLNPDFTLAFFEFCLSTRFLEFVALRLDGEWVGIVGLYARHGWLTTPLIGYDTTLPQRLGLYRRLMAILYREAKDRQLQLHLSSGADEFKLARGGQTRLEYTAVYSRHLPWSARQANRLFQQLMNTGAPRVLGVSV